MSNNTEDTNTELDAYWVISTIFGLIYVVEDKFGAETVANMAKVAASIEEAMRKEAEEGATDNG